MSKVHCFKIFGFLVLLFAGVSFSATYSGGSGTFADPYLISTKEDLITLSLSPEDWTKSFLQTNSIVFADSTTEDWNNDMDPDGSGTAGFLPIGRGDLGGFSGSYNGANYPIENLYINNLSSDSIGFFATTYTAEIDSVIIDNAVIRGNNYTGVLIGASQSTTVSNVSVDGVVYSEGLAVGGVIGFMSYGTISNSEFNGQVEGEQRVGGLIGNTQGNPTYSQGPSVENCRASGAIQANSTEWHTSAGGLIGLMLYSALASNSSFSGSVEGGDQTGGLVGMAHSTTSPIVISNSYSSGTVRAGTYVKTGNVGVGGLVGVTFNTIRNSFSSSDVESNSDLLPTGGLVGSNEYHGKIENSYSNGVVKGNGAFAGSNTSSGSYIKNSYSTGVARGGAGFVGRNIISAKIYSSYATGSVFPYETAFYGSTSSGIYSSFFDQQTSLAVATQNSPYTSSGTIEVTGLATDDFASPSSFSDWQDSGLIGTDSDAPWVLNEFGRPYLYWQSVAISNGKVVNDSTSGHILDVDPTDTISIVEKGIRYADTANINWIHSAIQSGEDSIIVSPAAFHSIVRNKVYYSQLYAITSDGVYHYGDMVVFKAQKSGQAISFDSIEDQIITAASLPLVASSTSGLTVEFSSTTSEVCQVVDNEIEFLSTGDCSVIASQSGNNIYASAASVTRTFSIDEEPTRISQKNMDLMVPQTLHIQVFTIDGTLVGSHEISRVSTMDEAFLSANLRGLPPGIYLLRSVDGKIMSKHKVF